MKGSKSALPPERRNHYIDPHSHVMVSSGVHLTFRQEENQGFNKLVYYIKKLSDDTTQIGNNSEPVILPWSSCI